ncbi:MAG: ArsA-related P-loop ATPase [Deltaproteobacteria bacterium]|nr:ArsA-related P-loop ATPase [Deltaproteobacteria bacterium]
MTTIAELIQEKKVVVCCGAGGVGKTTVSASLALAAARQGRRVLVVTIDPSKRLAETLGVSRNPPEPVPVSPEALREAGVEPPGQMHAWMLDPSLVTERVVRRFAPDDATAEELLRNRMYRNISGIVAGMQEYTAVEALYGFVKDDRFDLIILDTPPSRNALHFLEAPVRALGFLDGRIFTVFLPGEKNLLRRAAARLAETVLDAAFGKETRDELQIFLQGISVVLSQVKGDVKEMQSFFRTDAVSFLLVTSPAPEAIAEAHYFEDKVSRDLDMRVGGYVLNGSLAHLSGHDFPAAELLPEGAPEAAHRAIEKLKTLAREDAEAAKAHEALLADLASRARGGIARALPRLPEAVSDLGAVTLLADALVI